MKSIFKFLLFCFLTAGLNQGLSAGPLPPPPGDKEALIQSFKDYMQYDKQSSYIQKRLDLIAEDFFSKGSNYTTSDVFINNSGTTAKVFATDNASDGILVAIQETLPGYSINLGNVAGMNKYNSAYEVLSVEDIQNVSIINNLMEPQKSISALYKGPLVIMAVTSRSSIKELEKNLAVLNVEAVLSGELPYKNIFPNKIFPINKALESETDYHQARLNLINYIYGEDKIDDSQLDKFSVMAALLRLVENVNNEVAITGKLSDKTKNFLSGDPLNKEFLKGFCEYYSQNPYYNLDLTKEVTAAYDVIKILVDAENLDDSEVIDKLRTATDIWAKHLQAEKFSYTYRPKKPLSDAAKNYIVNKLITSAVNESMSADEKAATGDRSGAIAEYKSVIAKYGKALKILGVNDSYKVASLLYSVGVDYYHLSENTGGGENGFSFAKNILSYAYDMLKRIPSTDQHNDQQTKRLLGWTAYFLGTVNAKLLDYQKANEYQREASALGYNGPAWSNEDLKQVSKTLQRTGVNGLEPNDINKLLYEGGLHAFLQSADSYAWNAMGLIHDLMIDMQSHFNITPFWLYKFQDIVANNKRATSFESVDISDYDKNMEPDVIKMLDDVRSGKENVKGLLGLLFDNQNYYLKVFNVLLQDARDEKDPQNKADKLYKLMGLSLALSYFATEKRDIIPLNTGQDRNVETIAYETARLGGLAYAESYKFQREGGKDFFNLDRTLDKADAIYYRDVKRAVVEGRR